VLKLLLDEHISPDVAAGVRRRLPSARIHALAEWGGGCLIGQDDEHCMAEAARHGLTLVTYDRRTIPPLLKICAEEDRRHAGVVFVDEKTIAPADVGGLVRALVELTTLMRRLNWTDRVVFLRR
jgi:hypothetical protein